MLVRSRRGMEWVLKLGVPVPASRDPSGSTSCGLELGQDPVATPDSGRSGSSRRPLYGPWRVHDVAWCTSRAATGPRHAAAAAQSPATPSAHHDGSSPRSCDAPQAGLANACPTTRSRAAIRAGWGHGPLGDSASSCCSRNAGLDLPATIPALPPSRNCRLQFPIAYSETLSPRAASAIEISPCN